MQNIKKLDRQSNIELLRIASMFLIFANHMNGHGVMGDNVASLDYSLKSIVFIIVTSVVVCAAPVFVIISGYFGIKPTLWGGGKFSFICLFYCILCYLFSVLAGGSFSLKELVNSAIFISVERTGLWFLSAYLYLYCFSAVMNTWLKSRTQKQLTVFTIIMVSAIGIMSFLLKVETFNTFILFLALYSVGYYLKHTEDKYIQKIKDYSLLLFVATIALLSVWGILTIHQIGTESTIFCYTNPLVILQAVFLFLVFDKIKIKNSKMINHIAVSSFMVYMMSENIYTRNYFVSIVKSIFSIDSECLTIVTYIAFLFVAYLVLTAIDKILSKIYIPCINWINNTGVMKKLSTLFS